MSAGGTGPGRSGWLLTALAISALSSLALHLPLWLDPWTTVDDARFHLVPFLRFAEPGLLAGDGLTALVEAFGQPGYGVLHRLGHGLRVVVGSFAPGWAEVYLSPPAVAKLLPVGLDLACAAMLFRLGRRAGGPAAGLLVAGLFSLACHRLVGSGLQRAFLPPLVIALALCLVEGRRGALALVLVVSWATYPVAFVLGAGALGLGLLRGRAPFVDAAALRANLVPLAAVVLCLAAHALRPGERVPMTLGSHMLWQEVFSAPEFRHGGRKELLREERAPLAPLPFHPLVLGERLSPGLLRGSGPLLLGLAALLVLLAGQERRGPPRGLLRLVLAGAVLYIAAFALLFLLYYPSRYLHVPWLVLLLGLVAANLEPALARLHARLVPMDRLRRVSPRRLRVAAVGILLAAAAVHGRESGLARPGGIVDEARDPCARELIEFCAALPVDALIAGPPGTCDPIPLLAGRRVYLTEQALDLSLETSRRAWALTSGYFATRPEELRSFLEQEGIDFVIVDLRTLDPGLEPERSIHPPYRARVEERMARGEPFLLASPPAAAVRFECGPLLVLEAAALR